MSGVLRTPLTRLLGLDRPFVGAPMAGPAAGALAHAVSAAGGLGTIGVGSAATTEFVRDEAAIAGDGGVPFGIGLMAWAVQRRPELLDAAVAAHPALVSVSFGDVAPCVAPLHDAGIVVASQVHDVAEAKHAVRAGVDLIVAQGTDAGGHTGRVGTLPLLQLVLDAVDRPVLAAGGIATARGVGAALAAGAAGVWVGTALLASPETASSDAARAAIVQARETDTVLTSVFDVAQQIPWPAGWAGRALVNEMTAEWHGREVELAAVAPEVAERIRSAAREGDYRRAYLYAGQGVGAVTRIRPAAEIVAELCDGAERLLRGVGGFLDE